jgi:hypothetical protein
MRDIYDKLPPKERLRARRFNKERLAALDAKTSERQARLKKAELAKQKERCYNN